MSRDIGADQFRREMGGDWPDLPRTEKVYTVTDTTPKPKAKVELFIQWGFWMARDNGKVRAATPEEIEEKLREIAP